MGDIYLSENLIEEACNPPYGRLAHITIPEMTRVWDAICLFTSEQLLAGKQVIFPDFGTFLIIHKTIERGNKGTLALKQPGFQLSRTYERIYGLSSVLHLKVAVNSPSSRLNPSAIALAANCPREVVQAAIKDLFICLGNKLRLHSNIGVDLGCGILTKTAGKKNEVFVKFYNVFIKRMEKQDGQGSPPTGAGTTPQKGFETSNGKSETPVTPNRIIPNHIIKKRVPLSDRPQNASKNIKKDLSGRDLTISEEEAEKQRLMHCTPPAEQDDNNNNINNDNDNDNDQEPEQQQVTPKEPPKRQVNKNKYVTAAEREKIDQQLHMEYAAELKKKEQQVKRERVIEKAQIAKELEELKKSISSQKRHAQLEIEMAKQLQKENMEIEKLRKIRIDKEKELHAIGNIFAPSKSQTRQTRQSEKVKFDAYKAEIKKDMERKARSLKAQQRKEKLEEKMAAQSSRHTFTERQAAEKNLSLQKKLEQKKHLDSQLAQKKKAHYRKGLPEEKEVPIADFLENGDPKKKRIIQRNKDEQVMLALQHKKDASDNLRNKRNARNKKITKEKMRRQLLEAEERQKHKQAASQRQLDIINERKRLDLQMRLRKKTLAEEDHLHQITPNNAFFQIGNDDL